jgi:hypothetical protein
MAHAFESVEHYEEFAQQCEVQACFATSPAERDYFVNSLLSEAPALRMPPVARSNTGLRD